MDEATSALDKQNEKAINDAIENYKKKNGNVTILVIAHRLPSVRDADKIVVIDKGEIAETGTHDSLL